MASDMRPPRPPDLDDDDDASKEPGGTQANAGPSKSAALKGDKRTFITEQGAIEKLMLPSQFVPAGERTDEFSSCFEYQVPGNDTMKIAHWLYDNEDSKLSADLGERWGELLGKESHTLTEDELDWIEEVIPPEVYGHNGAFDVISIRTEEFGGRNVLVLENRWWDADRRAFGLFFASDPEFRLRESLHFEGTDKDYRTNFLSAKVSFMRMKWKGDA